jgi:hypothetical protein
VKFDTSREVPVLLRRQGRTARVAIFAAPTLILALVAGVTGQTPAQASCNNNPYALSSSSGGQVLFTNAQWLEEIYPGGSV